jgi:prepilin peptidase CpaA
MIEASWIEPAATAALTILVVVVAFFDVRERRIPNLAVLPAACFGLGLNLCWGWDGLVFGAQGLALGFALLFVPYLVGAMGAGDVKLLAAIGAFVGATEVVRVLLVTVLCYPLLAAILVIRERKVGITLLRFRRVLCNFLGFFVPSLKLYTTRFEARDDQQVASVTTPFGMAIAIGTLLALYTTLLR